MFVGPGCCAHNLSLYFPEIKQFDETISKCTMVWELYTAHFFPDLICIYFVYLIYWATATEMLLWPTVICHFSVVLLSYDFIYQIAHHEAQISRFALMSAIQLISPSVHTACYSALDKSAFLALNISTFLPVSVLWVLILTDKNCQYNTGMDTFSYQLSWCTQITILCASKWANLWQVWPAEKLYNTH